MKPIFIHWDMSKGVTVATGATEVHESSPHSTTVSSVVQCGVFHRHRGPYLFTSTKRNSYGKRRALSTPARQFMKTSNTPFMHSDCNCSYNGCNIPYSQNFHAFSTKHISRMSHFQLRTHNLASTTDLKVPQLFFL
jgi:hypothetical protein